MNHLLLYAGGVRFGVVPRRLMLFGVPQCPASVHASACVPEGMPLHAAAVCELSPHVSVSLPQVLRTPNLVSSIFFMCLPDKVGSGWWCGEVVKVKVKVQGLTIP